MTHLGISGSTIVALSLVAALPVAVSGSACSNSVTAATTIGPAGGTVHGPNGSEVVVPQGALSESTDLSIHSVPQGSAPPPGGGLGYAGEVYSNEGSVLCMADVGNPKLTTLHLPLLANLGAGNTGMFNIGDNPLLPQCRIDALAHQLQQNGWTGHVNVADPIACQVAAGPCP